MMKYSIAMALTLGLAMSFTAQAQGNEEGQKIVKVCSLTSVKANQEFQRNVAIMRAKRQAVIDKKQELDEAQAGDKAKLQTELDALLKDLNENNKTMFGTYGFSLTRNYTMVVETSHIFMFVSDEEAKNFEKAQKEKK